MVVDPRNRPNARKAWVDANKNHGVVQSGLDGIWHWLNGVADGIGHLFGSSVARGFKTVLAALHVVIDAYGEFLKTLLRLNWWVQIHVLKFLLGLIWKQVARLIAMMHMNDKRIIRLIYVVSQSVLAAAAGMVRVERRQRIIEVKRAEAQLRAQIRALHQTIEREAASAYRIQYDQRVSTIVRLLEFAVTREPALRDVVGLITKAVLDFVSVDDPLARLALGFIIRDVIDKLGIDRVAGRLIDDLLRPLLGEPKPRDLHGVIADVSSRLGALEGQLATFMEDGGSEVEQEGRLLRDITSPAAAVGILGFIGAAIADPQGWATAVTDVIGKPANAVVDATVSLVKGG